MDIKLNNPEPVMTGTKQTLLTWARKIESFADLPANFKTACGPVLGDIQPFPHVVFAPAIQNIRYPYTQKLLCEIGNLFYIWEFVGGKVQTSIFPFENISRLEMGSILLNSWMTVSGVTTEGVLLSIPIPFNTATLRHFLPLIQRIRPAVVEMGGEPWQEQLAKFDYLSLKNFKFMSFARESMVMGQEVFGTIWQPAIQRHIITILGRSFDDITTLAHLAILTGTELIVIHDDETSEENRGVRYGGVWHYIPIRHIRSLVLSEKGSDQLIFSVSFENGTSPLDLIFSSSNLSTLQQIQNQFSLIKNK